MLENKMDYKNLILEEKRHITKIVFNRPEVLNAVDYQTIVELKDILSKIKNDPEIRVIIITGSGEKSFIVGADKNEIGKRDQNKEEAERFENTCRETFSILENLGKPSICSINGYAFGLGLQLALACTFRFISSNAKLGLPEINFGFFPSMGATQRLTRLIGEAKAMELILTGDTIGGVSKILSLDEMEDYVEKFAQRLAEKDPDVMKLAIDAIRYEKGRSMEEGLAYEAKLSEICFKKKIMSHSKK